MSEVPSSGKGRLPLIEQLCNITPYITRIPKKNWTGDDECQFSADCKYFELAGDNAYGCNYGKCVAVYSIFFDPLPLGNPECHLDKDCDKLTKCQGKDCWCKGAWRMESTRTRGGLCQLRNDCQVCFDSDVCSIHDPPGYICICHHGDCILGSVRNWFV